MPDNKKKIYKTSLFIFRRDIRLHDNTGLLEACRSSESVIPAFFLDGRLLNEKSEKYRPNLIQFMFESLTELHKALSSRGSRLYLFYGKEIFSDLANVIDETGAEAVYVNEDYTPFSRNRDCEFENICRAKGVDFHSHFDLLLTRPGEILNSEGEPYRVFSWFLKSARTGGVRKPEKNNFTNFGKIRLRSESVHSVMDEILPLRNELLAQRGGRENGIEKLKRLDRFRDYKTKRNIPSEEGTTMMSAHLKFGTVSVREFYWSVVNKLGKSSNLIDELYWRDFFSHIAWFYPHVFKSSFYSKYDNVTWENDTEKFVRWCSGTTGFPIVDAGMRQLNQTGWMHNRVRMIVASFLTKDLHTDWRMGERYFASKLVDYDPSSNNGGWQWAASTGADAQPYFRVFNPWLQQKKYDREAVYIKKYIPELSGSDPDQIHSLGEGKKSSTCVKSYPQPIVDHSVEAEKAKELYKMTHDD